MTDMIVFKEKEKLYDFRAYKMYLTESGVIHAVGFFMDHDNEKKLTGITVPWCSIKFVERDCKNGPLKVLKNLVEKEEK